MSFHEVRFPTDMSFGSSGGPEFSTSVVTTASGYEQRNINWSEARARYNITHAVKTKAQIDALISFFRSRKGMAYGFRFKDWADYDATGESIGTGDGATTQFQLKKTYTSGSESYARNIKKPVSGTVKVYVDSVEQVSGVTINTKTGVVTFDSAPASEAVITADFEFDVPVRFDTDYLPTDFEDYGVNTIKNIQLVELRIQ